MVITKREDVIKQGFCKILCRKLRLRGSLLLVTYLIFWEVGGEMEWGGSGRLFECDWKGGGLGVGAYEIFLSLGWALIRGGP